MTPENLALISFVIITTYTPGPNNISAASMGVLYGYKRTLPYLLGMVSGFFVMLTLSGLVSGFLLDQIPAFETILRIVGALYILWLAWHTLKASYTFDEENQKPLGYLQGFLLQVLNVKVIVYGLTLYGTFLANKIPSFFHLVLSAALFASVGFTSVTLWTLFGAGIRKYLNRPKVGVLASALGMDKWRSKLLWQAAGLPVPDYVLLEADSDAEAVAARLGLPLFVKPVNEGSSIGVTKVKAAAELRAAFEAASRYDRLILAERYLGGGEYTVPILAGEALPVIRIVPATEFYDYEAKYFRDDTQYRCPCGLEPAQEQALQALALQAFRVLGGRDWGRIDILLDAQGNPYLLEANTIPGMTDHSLVPMAARVRGIDFQSLCLRILETSLERDER